MGEEFKEASVDVIIYIFVSIITIHPYTHLSHPAHIIKYKPSEYDPRAQEIPNKEILRITETINGAV